MSALAPEEITLRAGAGGKLPLRAGDTNLRGLLALGALLHTAETQGGTLTLQTNADGARAAASEALNALQGISAVQGVIGKLMAIAEPGEVDPDLCREAAWVVKGLADLVPGLCRLAGLADTAPALEVKAHAAKDALIVVDDFKPAGGKREVDELHRKAESLFRGAGNQNGRGRLSANLKQRAAYHPRGLVLATGEDIPKGQSLRARLTIANLSRDAADPRQGDIDLDRLTELQRHARDGRLAQAMAGYLQWLAPQLDELAERLPEAIRARRDAAVQAGMQGHSRTPSDFASLSMGLAYLADYAQACGALDAHQAQAFTDQATAALRALLEEQGEHQACQDDVTRFLALLASALVSGRCHVYDLQGNGRGCPTDQQAHSAALLGWRDEGIGVFQAQGARIGWLEEGIVYLDGDAAYAVVARYAGEQGGTVELTQAVLFRRIHERGLLACTTVDNGKLRLQVRKRIDGTRKWLYAVLLATLLGDEQPTATA